MTHTYAVLPLSRAAHSEIREKLKAADYHQAFHEDEIIDMHGIAVQPELEEKKLFDSEAELVRAIQARKLSEGKELIEAYGKARVNRVLGDLRKWIHECARRVPYEAQDEFIGVLDQIAELERSRP